MKTASLDATTDRHEESLYRQIAADLRIRIAKQYRPGDLLESERDLAAQRSVSQGPVRQALDILAHEGLIHRYHGRGTVVADRNATGEFAVVIWPKYLRPDISPYFSLTSTAIAEIMGARNDRWTTKLHVGRTTECLEDHPATLDLLQPDVLKRLRGVFSFHDLGALKPALRAARVPVVYFCFETTEPVIALDYQWLCDAAVTHLKDVGCRRVGAFVLDKGDLHLPSVVSDLAKARRLRIPPEWARPVQPGLTTEQDAYNAFCRLWKKLPHPDGLLVTDDMICRGVLRAILQLGVDLPGELRLISHANRGVALPYHKEVTRVEFDPAALAGAGVDMMMDRLRDPEAPPRFVNVQGTFVKGETT